MAIRFDGISDAVSSTSAILGVGNNISLFAWVKANPGANVAVSARMVSVLNSAGPNYCDLALSASARALTAFGSINGSEDSISASVSNPSGAWKALCLVNSGGATSLYSDGLTTSGSIFTNFAAGAPNVLSIGASKASGVLSRFFDGLIAYASIWDVALTKIEVMALSTGTPPWAVAPADLRACLVGDISPVYDRIGRIWTLTGSPKLVTEMPPATMRQGILARPYGRITLSGNSASPAAGAITLTGATPTRASGTVVGPATGSIVLTGATPSIITDNTYSVSPAAGSITLAGATPTAGASITVHPASGAITLTGATPSPNFTFGALPGPGQILFTGNVPQLAVNSQASPLIGAMIFTGSAPVPNGWFGVQPTPGTWTPETFSGVWTAVPTTPGAWTKQ